MKPFDLAPARRRLLYGWLLFAIVSAAIAGALAFTVAMTRTPGVRLLSTERAFQVVLVAHVTFALTIWLLAFVSALGIYTGAQAGLPLSLRTGWGALAISLAGTALITIPIVRSQGQAVMTDYVPLLDTPLFFVGFLTYMAGIGLSGVNLLAGVVRRDRRAGPLPLPAYGMACAAVSILTALVALAVAALRLGIGANGRTPAEYYQALFWGMGHSLQYVSVAAMCVAWFALLSIFLGEPKLNQRLLKGLFTLFAVFPLVTPLPYLTGDPLLVPTRKAWGIALDSGLSLPVMLIGPLLLLWAWRAGAQARQRASLRQWLRGLPWNEPRVTAFVFSAALFAVGLTIHPAARQGTLRTPAHYHGVIVGGVTLAFMGLAYHLLRQVGRSVVWRRMAALQPYLFAPGVMLMIVGLLRAGELGAPRKTYDAAVTGVAWLKPMVLMGLGAGIAAGGGALFVTVMLWSLLRRRAVARRVPAAEPVLASIGD